MQDKLNSAKINLNARQVVQQEHREVRLSAEFIVSMTWNMDHPHVHMSDEAQKYSIHVVGASSQIFEEQDV
ncbi:unnamed protein product [Caenorhabditis nigoni]